MEDHCESLSAAIAQPFQEETVMSSNQTTNFCSVYGPVSSWRYGRSLGIDPIGTVSTCSFNCVYCQLGEIEVKTGDRAIYVPTEKILEDLKAFAPWDVDVITLSGSGEPTLALNLKEILQEIKQLTHRPLSVLTNATTLNDPDVCEALTFADRISVKLDAVSDDQLRRVSRPHPPISLDQLWQGIVRFRQQYRGEVGIQTMLLTPWDEATQAEYIRRMQELQPDEIQLNTPTRPKPLKHEFEGRGDHSNASDRPYPVRVLKQVSPEVLHAFARKIQDRTGILVRCAPTPAGVSG